MIKTKASDESCESGGELERRKTSECFQKYERFLLAEWKTLPEIT